MSATELSAAALIPRLVTSIDDALQPHLPSNKYAILDFPDHSNVGDSAIWLGEIAYFRNKLNRRPAYVCRYNDFNVDALNRRVPEGPVFIHGGGNFGDIWDHHHRMREHVIATLSERKIVQLPQSIQFWSEWRRDQTARLIAGHKDFTLMVRDQFSLDLARRHFDCAVRLVPDMAFYLGKLAPGPPSRDVLALLRSDSEALAEIRDAATSVDVEDWLDEDIPRVRVAKGLGMARALLTPNPRRDVSEALLDAAAKQRVRRGLAQLSSARAIITDRLHAHILSLLLGRPHAVLDNNYGKIGRFMAAWSGGTPLTHVGKSLADAIDWARAAARNGYER